MHTNTLDKMDFQIPIPTGSMIFEYLREYGGYVVAFITGLGVMFGFYRKYCRGKLKAANEWKRAFLEAPHAVAEIKKELQFENGLSIRQWVLKLDENLTGLRQVLAFETISRRNLLDTVDTAMFECGKDGHFQWANKAYLEIADCTMQDVLGNNWRNVVAGPDREEVVDGWALAVRDGTDYRCKFRLALDSSEKWVRFHAVCNKDNLGNVLGFIGKLREIEDPRQAGQCKTDA